MRRILLLVTVALVMAAMMVVMAMPAFAHQAPCDDTLGPGHSEYATHHVVPFATTGALGAGGHIPGEHHGYAGLCGVQAPNS
jgi:hypothetical protein